MQIKTVKVCFEEEGKKYTFDCSDVFVRQGDKVVVETVRGLEVGTICSGVKIEEADQYSKAYKKVVRIATAEDLNQKNVNVEKQEEIKDQSQKVADSLGLKMKIVDAQLTLDLSKAVICFTADDRVDFRELVKQLANKFKMRVELKQIDAREETKILGGLGPCGRECCCSTFLQQAEHSSIKMAKVQGLSLNPSNISGLCGKLKCCLCYENEYYSEIFKKMPKINTEVITPNGKGLVLYNNLLKQTVTVKLLESSDLQNIKEFEIDKIKQVGENNAKK